MLSILDVLPKQDKPRLWLVARDGSELGSARPAAGSSEPAEPYCMMPSVIVRDYGPKVGAIPLAVYLVLSEHANRDAVCWPSYDTIARMLKLSRPTVIKAITILVENELVKIERRQDARGRDKSHQYRLLKHCTYRVKNIDSGVKDVDPSSSTYRVNDVDDGGKGDLLPGVNDVSTGGKNALPEPYTVELDKAEQGENDIVAADLPKRAIGAPTSFELTQDHYDLAAKWGVPADVVPFETDKFLDFHRAKGSTFKDWQAAWRTWMRNVKTFSPQASANGTSRSQEKRAVNEYFEAVGRGEIKREH